MKEMVALLSSGIGLGVYNPALILHKQLQRKGILSELLVIESFFTDDKIAKLAENRRSFHNNFKIAVTAMRMAKGGVESNIDEIKMKNLIDSWSQDNRKIFIILSGHWTNIVNEYISQKISADTAWNNFYIDTLNLDYGIAPSWKNYNNEKQYFNDIRFFGTPDKKMEFRLSVGSEGVIPFNDREERFLIHGGGWGLGENADKIEEMNDKNILLDIVVYGKAELNSRTSKNQYYLMDLDWNPWVKGKDGEHEFPLTYMITPSGDQLEIKFDDYQAVYSLCRKNKGIISKPGGGTLLDSLSSATPVIFTEALSRHEKENAKMWENLGFGITYDEWKESGFSMTVLEKLHRNIIKHGDHLYEYTDVFLQKSGLV